MHNSYVNIKTTITMMEEIVVEGDDSGDSIVELEVPRKPSPPLIHIEDEEIVLNVVQKKQESILAEDFIRYDEELSVTSDKATVPQIINTPNHWTSDMIKFYDDDWGDEEQFIVEKLQEKMDKSPSLWQISSKDRLGQYRSKRYNFKCWNCGQPGHDISFCPEPPYIPKCYMCGIEGHFKNSCPNSKCLNCGSHSEEYVLYCYNCRNETKGICSRCRMFGHKFLNCPDHWRLFHLTTKSTSVIIPEKNIYKSDKDMWCSNCGKQGHNQIYCTKRKDCGAFKDSLPFVISYKKAFNKSYYGEKQDEYRKKIRRQRNKDFIGNSFKKYLAEEIIRRNKMHSVNKCKKLKKQRKNMKRNKKRNWDCFPV